MTPIALLWSLSLTCPGADQVTVVSLLKELTDRRALAVWPSPEFTCRQFSSYDRASTSPDKQDTWFANGDAGQFLRTENDGKEFVMMDADGPGAVVRFWSANPAGTINFYLDGAKTPTFSFPMADLLSGKGQLYGITIAPPLAESAAMGWNCYLPIPYQSHCKITCDQNKSYYQINYRTYPPSTALRTINPADFRLDVVHAALEDFSQLTLPARTDRTVIVPGGSVAEIFNSSSPATKTPAAIELITLKLPADDPEARSRRLVLEAQFDGHRTVWCPVGDFFASGVGYNPIRDRYRSVLKDGTVACSFVMPFTASATLRLVNLDDRTAEVGVAVKTAPFSSPGTPMLFHAGWQYEYPIHAQGGKGTRDWNFITLKGKGVYVADTLAVMNPVPAWWGEGDEKIYIDGETFPSHFGTGTEDYYGYAWCCPQVYTTPLHSQPRCDGRKNNWGHTTVTRARSLDTIPFTQSLRFDMEVWHWQECDEAYANTTCWYAFPDTTDNRLDDAHIAAMTAALKKPIPQPDPLPPPFKIANAIECESLEISARAPGLEAEPQEMDGFARKTWSGDSQLWVRARKPGDFIELKVPAQGPQRITLYATRSWDYGIVKFSVNGKPAAGDAGTGVNLWCGPHRAAKSTGPIGLGDFEPVNGAFTIRAEVIGGDPKSEGNKSFFGLDALVLTAP